MSEANPNLLCHEFPFAVNTEIPLLKEFNPKAKSS